MNQNITTQFPSLIDGQVFREQASYKGDNVVINPASTTLKFNKGVAVKIMNSASALPQVDIAAPTDLGLGLIDMGTATNMYVEPKDTACVISEQCIIVKTASAVIPAGSEIAITADNKVKVAASGDCVYGTAFTQATVANVLIKVKLQKPFIKS